MKLLQVSTFYNYLPPIQAFHPSECGPELDGINRYILFQPYYKYKLKLIDIFHLCDHFIPIKIKPQLYNNLRSLTRQVQAKLPRPDEHHNNNSSMVHPITDIDIDWGWLRPRSMAPWLRGGSDQSVSSVAVADCVTTAHWPRPQANKY